MTEQSLFNLSNRILENVISKEDVEIVQKLFFSFEESIQDFDLIVVLAGEKLNRIKRAVELYHKRKVPILISGGSLSREGIREWEKYFQYGKSHGVLENNMIVEGESQNTYENLFYSLKILSEKKKFQRIVFVSSSFHLLRVSLTLLKVLEEVPLSIAYSFDSSDSGNISLDDWYLSRNGREEVATELRKIIKYHLLSYLNW